jgi:RNA polymerase sigma factor (sigma-70 family)
MSQLAASLRFARFICRARDGDRDALEFLLDSCVQKLNGVALRLIGKRLRPMVDSSDLLQATRIILWLGLQQGKWRVASEQSWTALARTILRRQVTRYSRVRQAEFEINVKDIHFAGDAASPNAGPSKTDSSADADLEDALQRVVARMNDTDRQLLRFRLLGYSTSEAATRLKVSASSLRMRLGRLRKRLLQCDVLGRTMGHALRGVPRERISARRPRRQSAA